MAAADVSPASPLASLFAYGTLLPGEPRWHHLAPFALDHGVDDAAPGVLADTGEGYPAARFDDRSAAIVHGRRFALDPSTLDEALRVLDDVEGAVDGLYHRILIRTTAGHDAWAYQYGGGLMLTPIPSGRWADRVR